MVCGLKHREGRFYSLMIKMLNIGFNKQTAIIAGAGLLVLYLLTRNAKATGEAVGGAAADLAVGVVTGAVKATAGAAAGVVLSVGDAVGVPRTDREKCILAQKNADHFEASKYCNAMDFINWELFNKKVY